MRRFKFEQCCWFFLAKIWKLSVNPICVEISNSKREGSLKSKQLMFPRWGHCFNLVANFTCHKVPQKERLFLCILLNYSSYFPRSFKNSQFIFPKTLMKGTHFLGSFCHIFPLSTISIQKCSQARDIGCKDYRPE